VHCSVSFIFNEQFFRRVTPFFNSKVSTNNQKIELCTPLGSTINLATIYHWVLLYYDEKTAEEKVTTVRKRCFIILVEEEIAIEAAKIKYKAKKSLIAS
jgi:hypothetical protein